MKTKVGIKGIRVAFAAASVLLIAAFADGAAAGPGKSSAPREGATAAAIVDPAKKFVPSEVLVRFREGVSAAARASALQAHGAARVRNLAVPGVILARLARGKDVQAAVEAFSKRADVVYAEPNWIYRAAATPNDPRYANGELWGLNQGTDVDIDAPEAWNVTTGSSNVVVAVVDTGVSYDHPDLAPNIWANPDEVANGVDDDGNGKVDDIRGWDFVDGDNDPSDWGGGHGTHVAGTIGAKGNNATGVVGVNWNVKLMPVRVLGPEGGSNDQVADGLAYAAANGAKVVNASLGGPEFSQTMKDAIDAAPGTLFVVAAGNGGGDGIGDNNESTPLYPCNYTSANLICVAATTKTDGIAGFSNFGTTAVDLGAPGTAIVSTSLGFESGYDTLVEHGFETAAGWVGGGAPNSWARTNETAAAGGWSATDSPGADYVNDTDNWFEMPGSVNLSGRSGCSVRYAMKLDADYALGLDHFLVEASDGDGSWLEQSYEWGTTPGYPNTWHTSEWELYNWESVPTFRLRFRFVSDADGVANGVHIDDVEVGCAGMGYDATSYESLQGTSMATPHVAGVAALAWAKTPAATLAQVKSALLNGGDAIASLTTKTVTGRRLNAAGTLALVGAAPVPLPTLSINDVSVTEGNSGTTNANFTVSLSAASAGTVTVNYATANGSATAPGDYTSSSGTVSFAPGQVTRPLTVPVVGDTTQESTETFSVNLAGAANATIADATGVGTINDNDAPVGSFGLTVAKGGTGFGKVTGSGIDCGTDCFQSFASGTSVTLTAVAGPGSVLASWSGCTSPSGASCTMTMNTAKTVTASFTATPTFADVSPSNPFYEYIEHLYDLGITTGCGTNGSGQRIYCPGDNVSRQQMAAFLVRAKGLTPLASPTPTFADVPASNPFYGWIERLYQEGITTGCGTNSSGQRIYCPGDNVSRQQMAAFLIRAFVP